MTHDEPKIDPTLWLPLRTPMVTPERAAKGDLRIEKHEHKDAIRFAQAQVRNILNYLHEIDVLDAFHVAEANCYEIWHEVYAAARGSAYRNNSLYGRGDAETEGKGERGFSLLLRRLSRRHHLLIEQAIQVTANEHTKWLAHRQRHAFVEAFDRLVEIMPGVLAELNRKAEDEKSLA